MPAPTAFKTPPSVKGSEVTNASIDFIGTATTLLTYRGLRILTDPNFLHAGDHVHLGPGVTAKRLTDPAIELENLPPIDMVLLSHYHGDHFDQRVEAELRRDMLIVTTSHAKESLEGLEQKKNGEGFTNVHAVEIWDSLMIDVVNGGELGGEASSDEENFPAVKITGMPGKHVPPGFLNTANEFLQAVPPTNGWMVELGYKPRSTSSESSNTTDDPTFTPSYRIYITGDTLLVDDLKEIPKRYAGQNIDLMLCHLGGTTIPGPSLPLLMVTMDAEQGVQLMRLIGPDLTIPIHFDDYDVFLSPLEDFKKKVAEAGFDEKVVYLDRGDRFDFNVK